MCHWWNFPFQGCLTLRHWFSSTQWEKRGPFDQPSWVYLFTALFSGVVTKADSGLCLYYSSPVTSDSHWTWLQDLVWFSVGLDLCRCLCASPVCTRTYVCVERLAFYFWKQDKSVAVLLWHGARSICLCQRWSGKVKVSSQDHRTEFEEGDDA